MRPVGRVRFHWAENPRRRPHWIARPKLLLPAPKSARAQQEPAGVPKKAPHSSRPRLGAAHNSSQDLSARAGAPAAARARGWVGSTYSGGRAATGHEILPTGCQRETMNPENESTQSYYQTETINLRAQSSAPAAAAFHRAPARDETKRSAPPTGPVNGSNLESLPIGVLIIAINNSNHLRSFLAAHRIGPPPGSPTENVAHSGTPPIGSGLVRTGGRPGGAGRSRAAQSARLIANRMRASSTLGAPSDGAPGRQDRAEPHAPPGARPPGRWAWRKNASPPPSS